METDHSKIPIKRYIIKGTDIKERTGYLHEPSGLYFLEPDMATIYENKEEAEKITNPNFAHELIEAKVCLWRT